MLGIVITGAGSCPGKRQKTLESGHFITPACHTNPWAEMLFPKEIIAGISKTDGGRHSLLVVQVGYSAQNKTRIWGHKRSLAELGTGEKCPEFPSST